MGRIVASLAVTDNPRTKALRAGEVRAEGIDWAVTTVYPSEMFWRQLKFGDWDISEMSLSTLMILADRARRESWELDWVALPVFTTRRFFHTNSLWVRADRGISSPEDLRGKRVGVPEYQQTAAVWTRGALEHHFGVKPSEIEWHMERTSAMSHGGATGFEPPPGVTVKMIPEHESIGTMLVDGSLDATIRYIRSGSLVDRSRTRLEDEPSVVRLFDPPETEAARFHARTGMFPVNHCVVLKRQLAEAHPWAVLNVFNAFCAARDAASAGTRERVADHVAAGLVDSGSAEQLGTELFKYGVHSNRAELDALSEYSHEQGLTSQRITPEMLFDPRTHAL